MSNKSVGFRLEFQGAQSTVDQLLDVSIAMDKINTKLKELKKGGGFEKNIDEVRKLKLEQRALQEQTKELRKEQQKLIDAFKESQKPKDTSVEDAKKAAVQQKRIIEEQKQAVREAAAEQKRLKEEARAQDKRNAAEAKKAIQEARLEQKRLKEEAKQAQMDRPYNRLNRELNELRKKIQDIRALGGVVSKEDVKRVNELDRTLKKIDSSVGLNQRNVGNYPKGGAFGQGLRGAAEASIGPAAALMSGPLAAGALAGAAVVSNFGMIKEFEQAVADLNAIANVSERDLERLKESALDLSGAFSPAEVINLQEELSKLGFSVDEIMDLTESVINLSVALGGPANETAALLGATLNGFGADASQAAKYAEVLAAAANKSALDFADFEIALPKVSAAAKVMGLTIEDVAAQLGVLRDRGLRAENAGVGLRNVFLEAAKAGVPFDQQLQKIKDSKNQLSTATNLYGKENAIVAITLANNKEAFEEMKSSITGTTGELERLAAVKLDTVEGKIRLLGNAWDKFTLSVDSGNGALSRFVKFVAEAGAGYLTGLTAWSDGLLKHANGIQTLFALTGDADIIAMLEKKQDIAQNRGGGRGRGGVQESGVVLAERYSAILDDIDKKLTWANRGEKEWVILKKDQKFYTDKLTEAQKLAAKEAKELAGITTGDTGGGGGGDGKKKGVHGSVEYYQSILKSFKDQLPLLDQQSKEWQELTLKVAEYERTLNGLKASEKARFDEIEDQRNKAFLSTISPTSGVPQSIGREDDTLGGLLADMQTDEAFKKKKEANDKELEEKQKFLDELAQQSKEYRDNDEAEEKESNLRKLKEREDYERALKELAFDMASQFADIAFSAEMDRINKQKDAKLAALDEEYARKNELAAGDAELQKRLDKEQAAERKKIEKEAFEQNKKLAILQAIINGALSVGQAFATLPPPAAIAMLPFLAAQTLIQVTTIAAQKFAKGGKVKRIQPGLVTDAPNVPPTPEGDSVLGLLAPGETVLTRKNVDDLGGPAAMARIGVPGYTGGGKPISYFYPGHRIPAYNDGGYVGNYDFRNAPDALISTNGMPANANATFSNDQMVMMSDMIASKVANAFAQLLPTAFMAIKEGAFQALNEDKRLKEREASANQNSNF